MTSEKQSNPKRAEERLPAQRPDSSPVVPVRNDMPVSNEQGQLDFYAQSKFYSGPLPPPEVLGQFGLVDKSFPERIVTMAEREQRHRHGVEVQEQGMRNDAVKRGQTVVAVLGLAGIAAAVVMVLWGNSAWVGGILGFSAFAPSIFAAVWGKPMKETGKEDSPRQERDH